MNIKQIVYISGPYSGSTPYAIYANITLAREYAVEYWKKGYAVFCPHLNSCFMDHLTTYEDFIEGDLAFLRHADIIVMLPNWRSSNGARREHEEAKVQGKKIVYEPTT